MGKSIFCRNKCQWNKRRLISFQLHYEKAHTCLWAAALVGGRCRAIAGWRRTFCGVSQSFVVTNVCLVTFTFVKTLKVFQLSLPPCNSSHRFHISEPVLSSLAVLFISVLVCPYYFLLTLSYLNILTIWIKQWISKKILYSWMYNDLF